jgi:hypothetical protein
MCTLLILAPFERGESSKTGIYHETIMLDDVHAPWLGEMLKLQISRQRVAGADADLAPVWGFTAKQYLVQWREAVKDLKLEKIAQSPYQNRHGGASRDHLQKARTVPEMQVGMRLIRSNIRQAREVTAGDQPGIASAGEVCAGGYLELLPMAPKVYGEKPPS